MSDNLGLLVLPAIILISPIVLAIASKQEKGTKQKLRQIFLLLLILQLFLGLLGWESLPFSGRTGFELAFAYPNAFLWLFFVITIVQIALLTSQKHTAHIAATSLNFLNTLIIFASLILISKILTRQIVSLASIGTVFLNLTASVVSLALANKDKNLLTKK
ncbi:MAG: hypothetical protein Q7T50_04915 [Candidatus Magasanikbacteria bacterium]|nr:hypothetical protein [Candidatus Magasanikbacteria bacterium]